MVSVMVWAAAEVSAGVYQTDGICCHSLGPVCAEKLAVGGFVAPSVTGTWSQLYLAAPSVGGAVGRIVSPGGIVYGTV